MKKNVVLFTVILMIVLPSFLFAEELPGNMVLVNSGEFEMGNTRNDTEGEKDEKPLHTVKISYDYYIGKYEVTNAEYAEFLNDSGTMQDGMLNGREIINTDISWLQMKYENGKFVVNEGKENYPMMEVNWYGAVEYCNWLSEKEGLDRAYDDNFNRVDYPNNNGYRLPTEAEWEYAARGGHKSFNDYKYSGSDDIDEVAWYWRNSGNTVLESEWDGEKAIDNGCVPHPVGQKKANELGIYDMSGNVWEYCHDYYSEYTDSEQIDPVAELSDYRCGRGGSWFGEASFCRISNREFGGPYERGGNVGFRIVRTLK